MMRTGMKYDFEMFRKALVKSVVLMFSVLLIAPVFSQDIYKTKDGNMLITTVSADTILTLSTKNVVIFLNNQNAKFTMKIDKSKFVTNNDSLNNQLASLRSDFMTYTGKLDLINIDKNDHSPLDFSVEGVVSTNNKTIKGTGRLEHISSEGNLSCLLTLKFNISKDDLGLNLEGLNLEDEIQIDIAQVLLNNNED